MTAKQFIQTLTFFVMLAGFAFLVFGIVHTDDIGKTKGVRLIIMGVLAFLAGAAGYYVSSIIG